MYVSVSGYRACDPAEMYNCADGAIQYFFANYIREGFDKSCDCPTPCKDMRYFYTLSSNRQSDYSVRHLAETYFVEKNCTNSSDPNTCAFYPDIDETIDSLSKNIVDVEIYFETLTFEEIEEWPAYLFLNLLCDIGGAMGLILGSTVLTVVELGEFLSFLIYDAIYFKLAQVYLSRKLKKVTPSDLNAKQF